MSMQSRMRDPQGNKERYATIFQVEQAALAMQDPFDSLDLEGQLNRCRRYFGQIAGTAVHEYGDGLPIEAIRDRLLASLPELNRLVAYFRTNAPQLYGPGKGVNFRPIDGSDRRSFAFLALTVLTTREPVIQLQLADLLSRTAKQKNYLFDLLVRAFEPGVELAPPYEPNPYIAPLMDPVLRALALPPGQRAKALAAHMSRWPRLMAPWGWKPNLDTAPGKDSLFCDFAFEVALAVCAYDIDDSEFAGHPYYPRDLVQFYRTQVRASRDAWRAHGAGAGEAIDAPPSPPKADLAKSKRKGIARWLELVCDGDDMAVDSIAEAVGKPRKVKDLHGLAEALAAAGHALQADIKDDQTVALSLDQLADGRGLGEFGADTAAQAGPDRCAQLLLAFSSWAAERRYLLVDLDGGDDVWRAVLVRADYRDEFAQLSQALGIATRDAEQAYAD